ncbi:MAG: hypothetical protein K1060chlam4_00074 [Candidatus Anoxychlamydiales bacterium]|nr:hypothetical protein [Candidatus Anoxychlamydiales bacterium]NGX53059.1 hypothetical protein [Candidatus Anoxychlamydiales bacterium]
MATRKLFPALRSFSSSFQRPWGIYRQFSVFSGSEKRVNTIAIHRFNTSYCIRKFSSSQPNLSLVGKKLTFENFKQLNPFEKFIELPVITNMLSLEPVLNYSTIEEWYEDYCRQKFLESENGANSQLILFDVLDESDSKTQYPILKKGEKKLDENEFIDRYMEKFDDFINKDLIKTLRKQNPTKYNLDTILGIYDSFCFDKYTKYKDQIGFWKNQLTFEEYTELYTESFEDYKENVKELKFTEEKNYNGYQGYCKCSYNRYKMACEYGPYYDPGRML